MAIIKALLIGVFFFIFPTLVGMNFTRFIKEEKDNIIYSFILGYIVEFGIFQIYAIPCIVTHQSFSFLYNLFLGTVCALSLLSVILNFKNYKSMFLHTIDTIKELPKITTAIVILMVLAECFIGFKYMHVDQDDFSFLAYANDAYQTDTLYKYDIRGNETDTLPIRRFLSPWSIFIAAASKFVHIQPIVVAHTFMPSIFPIVVFLMYYLMGKILFKNDLKDTMSFLVFLNFIYLFGAYTGKTAFIFMFVRIWQGKSLLANLILPFLYVIYNLFAESNGNFITWLGVLFTMLASCLVSAMGFALAPVLLVALTISYFFREKKISLVFKSAVCCVPVLIYIGMYLSAKGETLL